MHVEPCDPKCPAFAGGFEVCESTSVGHMHAGLYVHFFSLRGRSRTLFVETAICRVSQKPFCQAIFDFPQYKSNKFSQKKRVCHDELHIF